MATVDLLTNRFVGSVEHASELYLLDRYRVGDGLFEYGNWLFPDKTIDLYGKSIRVATFYINPHMLIKEADVTAPEIRSKNRTFSMDGLNGLILVEFCRQRNCTIELVIDEVNMWGVILPNRTGNGIIGDVAERRADLGIGALSSWYNCYQYLTFSTPITRGSVTCLVPKPNLIPGWKLITMVFATSVYLFIFGTFCAIVLVYMLIAHFMIRKIEQKSVLWNAFNVLAIFLLQSANIRNRSASEAILTVTVLLYVMNMDGIYSGKYASLRTIPIYEPAINTLNDLASSGIPWLQTHKAWSFSLLLSKNPMIVKLVTNFRAYPPSELRRIADQGGAAFALSHLNIGHLMLGEWITANNIHKYRLMREELFHEHEVAMGTKTWPLMERFNEVISRTGSGLLMHAQRLRIVFQYDDYFVHTVALNSHDREVNDPTALRLDDILGGLIVLGFGLLCAGAVFMMEVMFVRRSRRSI
ncbi:glutamate receptor ionotropic, delta-2-like [Ochlerotatus camptorhynchus]|uniref:glutamate receptor ionotropic, delta-2-like n=1 Tax=Ochlerotatus camptorhynchus TaxID=644619 RepID=UPI0031D00C25